MPGSRRRFSALRFQAVDRLGRVADFGRAAIRKRRTQVVVVATAVLVTSNVLIVFVTDTAFVQQFLSTGSALLITFLGVYVSFDIIAPYLKNVERRRIGSADDVVAAYDDDIFIDLEEMLLNGVGNASPYSPVAAAIEDVPATPMSLGRLQHQYRDEMYEIPPDLEGVLEPSIGEMNDIFQRADYFSELKPRLDCVTEQEFHFSKTSYYRSFLTNFCPDLDLGAGRTLRTLTKSAVVADGDVRSLAESPFSNHLGGAGLVVTTAGVTALSTRSGEVAVDKYAKSLSFSGALSLGAIRGDETILAPMLTEMKEELDIPPEAVRETLYLGTTRRMERLGKPDVLGVILVDEADFSADVTSEFSDLSVIDIQDVSDLQSVEDLLHPHTAQALLQELLRELDQTTRHASIGLLSFMALYSQLVERTTVSS